MTATQRYKAMHKVLLALGKEAKLLADNGEQDRARSLRAAAQLIAQACGGK